MRGISSHVLLQFNGLINLPRKMNIGEKESIIDEESRQKHFRQYLKAT